MKFGVDWMLQNAAKERNQVANEWWQYLSGGEASCFCAEPATGRKKRGEEERGETRWMRFAWPHSHIGCRAMGAAAAQHGEAKVNSRK
jgi:hypothetical protein